MSKLHELSVLGSSGAWRYYPLRIDCDSSASHDAIAWQYHASNGDDAAKIHNILVRVHKNNKKGAKYLEDKREVRKKLCILIWLKANDCVPLAA